MGFHSVDDVLDMDPDHHLVYSPDVRYTAGWYVCSHEEDRYRERVMYHVNVWDLGTGELVARYVRGYEFDYKTSRGSGEEVTGVAFSEDSRELIIRIREIGAHDTEREERELLPDGVQG